MRVGTPIRQLGGLSASWGCYLTVRKSIRVLGLLFDSQEIYPLVRTPIRQLGGQYACWDSYPTVRRSIRVMGLLSDS